MKGTIRMARDDGTSKVRRTSAAFLLMAAISLPAITLAVIIGARPRRRQQPAAAPLWVRPAGGAAARTGTPARVPWTTSRLVGSPEPPPPYRVARAYPKINFKALVDADFIP